MERFKNDLRSRTTIHSKNRPSNINPHAVHKLGPRKERARYSLKTRTPDRSQEIGALHTVTQQVSKSGINRLIN